MRMIDSLPRIERLESRRLLAATYYVSPSGSDALAGTSPAAAWRSLDRVSAADLNAGDRVLFEGGKTFSAAGSTGSNVVVNPGFESGLNGWNDTMGLPAANATVTSSSPRSGAGALRISGSGTGVRAQNLTAHFKPNQAYTMSGWTRATSVGGGDRRVGVTFYQSGRQVATFYRGFRSTEWEQTQWAFVAPERFDKALLWVMRTGDSSTFYVDDLSLRSIPNGIVLNSADSGTVANPVVIASYGAGKATINAADGIGLWGGNVAGVRVQNLKFAGSWDASRGAGGNTGVGIEFVNTRSDNSKLEFLTIEKCEARGFRWAGARIGGWAAKSGFRTVLITDSKFIGNGDAGVMIRGMHDPASTLYANEKVYIARSVASNNTGIPGKAGNTGSGFQMTDTLYGTIERSIAHHNGALNHFAGGGPVGIWAFDATKITLQYNESYSNRSGSGKDGAGFDLDGGVTNSVMQNNYAHDNDGAGFLLCQFDGARAWGRNIVRYNISQNDARRSDYGAVTLTGGAALKDVVIEHNTLYLTATAGGASGVRLKSAGTGVRFRNNIIQTSGGARLVHADTAGRAAEFHGNAYWSSGAAFAVRWGSTTHGSLAAWRAGSGREKIDAVSTGVQADPGLVAPGTGPTVNDAYNLASLTQYKLRSSSVLRDKAVVLRPPHTAYTTALVDFFGVGRLGQGWDVGASESG